MLYNFASVILSNLFFCTIDDRLREGFNAHSVAYSPVMDCAPHSEQIQMAIRLQSLMKQLDILIAVRNFSRNERDLFQQLAGKMMHEAAIALNVICKKHITLTLEQSLERTVYTTQSKEIVISLTSAGEEKEIHMIFPIKFFSLFSNSTTPTSSAQFIESEIIRFFREPQWMIPDLQYLFSSLSSAELSILINHLQKSGFLTPYQVFLIINAFPELSGAIKGALSRNCINDVIQYNKDKKLKITKRDIAGGIYSVEESLAMLMKKGIDLNFSTLMRQIQHIVQMSLSIDLVLKKDFPAWLSEIRTRDLLHATISMTEDPVMAAAIGRDSGTILPLLQGDITKRKMEDIQGLLNPSLSYDEIMKSRLAVISNYRTLTMKQLRVHPDRLAYLLSAISNPKDYQYLLLSAGWFILSTALKGLPKRLVDAVVSNLPYSAGVLIEDVLKGIVNPNILHDEIQINKARMVCVGTILQLYIDSVIDLE